MPSRTTTTQPIERARLYWILQAAGWGGYALFRIVPGALLEPPTPETVASMLLTSATGLLLTHGFRAVIHRRSWTQMSLRRLAPRILGAALLMAGVSHLLLLVLQRDVLGFRSFQAVDSTLALTVHAVSDGFFIYLVWSLLYVAITYFWNYQQAEVDRWKMRAQMETAKLDALKLQLNPHFLFNSLNSVRALIAERPERAQHMVTRLAHLLRTTLQGGTATTVPLDEELQTTRVYLELEAVRLEERLQYRIDASEAVRDHPVPFLLVQTLAENAIKHGVAQRPEGGTVAITARRAGAQLRIRVDNPGQVAARSTDGVGLHNARERLRLLFGEHATLTLRNAGAATVRAEARIPLDRSASPDVPSSLSSTAAPTVP